MTPPPTLPTTSERADFITIDFETANASRASACSVGVAVVRDGSIVTSGSALINPETDLSPYNTRVHGLEQSDVEGAPTFAELWPQLSELLAGQTVVAHMATFDLGVLRQSVARYELDGIDFNALCSWRLAKRVWEGFPSYGLSYVSNQLDIELDHHEAASDAAACAEVVHAAIKQTGSNDIGSMCTKLGFAPAALSPDSFVGQQRRTKPTFESNPDADPNHPLFGKAICFTGTMHSMTRNEAAELVCSYGAEFKKNVSGTLDILVTGDADFAQFADGHQTGKLKKAVQLNIDGHKIEIMAERDLLALLAQSLTHSSTTVQQKAKALVDPGRPEWLWSASRTAEFFDRKRVPTVDHVSTLFSYSVSRQRSD